MLLLICFTNSLKGVFFYFVFASADLAKRCLHKILVAKFPGPQLGVCFFNWEVPRCRSKDYERNCVSDSLTK